MDWAVFAVGTLVAVLSATVCVIPDAPIRALRSIRWAPRLKLLGSALRIAIGVVLILGASHTRYPTTIAIVGVALVLLGGTFLFMSNARFEQIMARVLAWITPTRVRLGSLLGIALGAFIAHAAS